MLVTLHKDSRSSFLGVLDDEIVQDEAKQLRLAGLSATGFTVEVPYTPQGASVLVPVLLSWRHARPGRTVTLTLADHSVVELGDKSAAAIEWLLPLVEQIAIVELPAPPEPAAAD